LVADTFALSGVPGGASITTIEATSYVRGTLENVIEQRTSVLKHNIPLELDKTCDGSEPFARISPTDLTRIATNLLDNSISACFEALTHDVSVSIGNTGHMVLIRVRDNGCGIDPAHQGDLFHSGFTTKGEGRGKGLSSSQKLAEKWNGRLHLVRSNLRKGTEIELQLPGCPTPPWFVNRISLTAGSILVVVDDEGPVCDYWEKRFSERLQGIDMPDALRPQLRLIRRAEDLKRDGPLRARATHFFVDYKFEGANINGIQLIEDLQIE
jgi:hypothetical protein